MLQQHLPFTVLKHAQIKHHIQCHQIKLQQHLPFTVLKLSDRSVLQLYHQSLVATAPTVYGIETELPEDYLWKVFLLQQHLPFTVLKPNYRSM